MKKLLFITVAVLALTSQTQVIAAEAEKETNKDTTLVQMVEDAKIVTLVNSDLLKDTELSVLKINVESTQGKVVLKGSAPNTMAKERAETIVKNVKGVVSVDNRLIVTKNFTSNNHGNMNNMSNNKMDDASINIAVNAALVGDADLSAFKINVHVNNGKVVLKGTAPSLSAKNHATELTKNVDGVKSVYNELVINTP